MNKRLLMPTIWLIVILSLVLPTYSIYISLTQPEAFTRIGSYGVLGTAKEGFVDAEQSNFNELGAFCATLTLLTIGLFARPNQRVYVRLALLAMGAIYFGGAILTGSRSAVLALLLGLVAMTFLLRNKQVAWIGVAILIIVFVARVDRGGVELFLARVTGTFDAGSIDNESAVLRVASMQAGWQTFLAHPLIGVGYLCFRNFNSGDFITPECYFLEILADLGLLGLGIWVWYTSRILLVRKRHLFSLSSINRSVIPRILIPAICCLLATNLTGDNFVDPGLLLLFMCLSGMVEVSLYQNDSVESVPKPEFKLYRDGTRAAERE